jgi:hypothetical protein
LKEQYSERGKRRRHNCRSSQNRMREIVLGKGKVSVVDDEDYEYLSKYKWRLTSKGYACRTYMENGKQKYILMHREIMRVEKEGRKLLVDHKDHNILNNSKENLRLCSTSQNACNTTKKLSSNFTSGFKGVSWDKQYKKWAACIKVNGKSKRIGRFINESDAAISYNKYASQFFGEFAILNAV